VNSCPYCGSVEVEYEGIDTDLGDYGTSICDIYRCLGCGQQIEVNCYDTFADLLEADEDVQ